MKLSLLLIPCLLAGCKLPEGRVVSVTQSVIGIKVGQNVATGTPELQLGFFRSTFQVVPTSTNRIYAPMVNSSLSLDQKSWATSVDEDFVTGGATPSPNSVAQRGITLRGKTPLATKGPLPRAKSVCSCTNLTVNVPAPDAPTVVTNANQFAKGFSVVFPSPPTAETVALLDAAGAVKKSETVFVIESYNRFDPFQNAAVEASLKAGATLRNK